jgi:hypothetical protein
VDNFYSAVNSQDYQTAWSLGGSNLSKTYSDFVAGFDGTAHDAVTIASVSGSIAQVDLAAEQTDGTTQYWAGSYTVTDGVITHGKLVRTD